jgi:hypothetical protein
MMDIIVNPKVEKDIASKSYKTLQHVLYSTGSNAFENIWDFNSECEDVWPVGYDNFWKFIKDKFNMSTLKMSTQNTEDDQVRTIF